MTINHLRAKFPETEALRLANITKRGRKEFVGNTLINGFKAYRQEGHKVLVYRVLGRNANYAYLLPIRSL